MYDQKKKHLGAMDPKTGKIYKDPVTGKMYREGTMKVNKELRSIIK